MTTRIREAKTARTRRARDANTIDAAEARRIAIAAQGLARPRPSGRVTATHLEQTLERLGVLQLDFVNVLTPAHYFVPFSRLGPYDRRRLDRLVYQERKFTEQWAHEACIVPMRTWALFRHRREQGDLRARHYAAHLRRHAEHARAVLEIVRERGPVAAGQVADPGGSARKRGPWWDRSLSKTILEGHFAEGRLAVAERRADFARLYDLTERVVPRELLDIGLDEAEARRELLRHAARAHGIGTAKDLADYYRMALRDARAPLAELTRAGELVEVQVEGWREPAYLHRAVERPRRVEARALLSPFDPLVWCRPRVERLFQFEYRIEIYTPNAKRRWGYYVLPFLFGDRLVARVDLKADRAARRLLALAAHHERTESAEAIAGPLAEELHAIARWLDLERVVVSSRGNLARALRAVIAANR